MVVHVNQAAGEARVSCRLDGQVQVMEVPLDQVAKRVASSAGLILDNLNAPATAKRITEQEDGWYFAAREGQVGPFRSRKEAGRQLVGYILKMQSIREAPREPRRSAERRRGERLGAPEALTPPLCGDVVSA